MPFVNITAALVDVLETVKTNNTDKLAAVFNYDVPGPDLTGADAGYPYACLSTQDAEEEPLDTATNKALYKFLIRAVDVAIDKADTETAMRGLADAILAELRKRANDQLGGICDKVFPFKTVWRWHSTESTPYRIFEIEVTIQESLSID